MTKRQRLLVAALAVVTLSGACNGLLEVTNPGPILDSSLYTAAAVPALVVGMSSDLSNEMDELARFSMEAGDEMGHGGSYTPEQDWSVGSIIPEDMTCCWPLMNATLFEATSGVARMKGISGFDYNHSPYAARANMIGGFANRTLGETQCYAIINGGPAQSRIVYFQNADSMFTEAIRIAQQATTGPAPYDDKVDVLTASYAGRASVRAWQGNWAAAVADAMNVPDAFVYYAPFSSNSTKENNSIVQETYVRREFSVWGSQWMNVFNDPRVPWDTVFTGSGTGRTVQTGQDGSTPFLRQQKYGPSFSTAQTSIPLVHGTEMLMLRAEAALRTGDIAGSIALINEQRAVYAMTPLATPPDLPTAWTTLEFERGAVVWMEARRFWDLQRWYAAVGPSHNNFLSTRSLTCQPIEIPESQTNVNLIGLVGANGLLTSTPPTPPVP